MQQTHHLSIPNLDTLTDPETFFAYLYTLIERFHECLFCGRCFDSGFEGDGGGGGAEKARQHMRDKGHCGIDGGNEEFRGFWEDDSEDEDEGDGDASTVMGKEKGVQKLRLESEKFSLSNGRMVRTRWHRLSRHPRPAAITDTAAETILPNSNSNNSERSIAISSSRREQGIIGLSSHAKQSLRATEKKMIRVEMRARNEMRAGVEKVGNKQKHFRADAPGGRPNG